jgi:chemotaxis protein methyltransferase WspC
MAFAFRYSPDAGPMMPERRRANVPPVPVKVERRRAAPDVAARTAARNAARTTPLPAMRNLAQVRELADQGRLAEARAAGERLLREGGPGADVFCLLGTIRGADGDAAAADALYRKALYLDPGHRETLAHLALLLESRGRGEQARVLRTRLQRLGGEP